MEEKLFRVTIRGFHRGDVATYISEQATQLSEQQSMVAQQQERIASLEAELDATRTEKEQLQTQLQTQLEEVTAQLTDSQQQAAQLQLDLTAAQEEAATSAQGTAAVAQELSQAHAKNQTLLDQNAALQASIVAFEKERATVTEIEVGARTRAHDIEHAANQAALRVQQEAEVLLQSMQQKIAYARDEYRITVRRTQEEALRMEQKTTEIMETLAASTAAIVKHATEGKGNATEAAKAAVEVQSAPAVAVQEDVTAQATAVEIEPQATVEAAPEATPETAPKHEKILKKVEESTVRQHFDEVLNNLRKK